MQLSKRVQEISDSITLKLNAQAVQMAADGRKVYNLTAGQLPFRPLPEFTDLIKSQTEFLKSYQYSPVAGFSELRLKLMDHFSKTRDVELNENFDCIVSNGGKHALFNVMSTLFDAGDEVIMMAPYWVSYPEMIKLCGATEVVVKSSIFDAFVPSVSDIQAKITAKTKAIILNSPNNPSGIHYSEKWMKEFADMIADFPHVTIISDEIYFELFYYDPAPTYFYQYRPELLARTIIVDGISKALASTGLRIGYVIANKDLVKAMGKFQAQTSSGANSLIQRALIDFDLEKTTEYLQPVKQHLRENSFIIREKLRDAKLGKCWYQSTSAFYFLLDFSQMPCFESFYKQFDCEIGSDISGEICANVLNELGVAMVPGGAFGVPNSARISLVADHYHFSEAIECIVKYFSEAF